MNIRKLESILLLLTLAAALQPAAAQPVVLSGNRYTNTFDDLETLAPNLEPGWGVYTNASATSLGNPYPWAEVNYRALTNSWTTTSGRFGNQASTFCYVGHTNFLGTESRQIQTNELNRCLALRQTRGCGDPGGAFVLQLQDTLNRQNFQLSVDLLNLDASVTQTTTWTVDYGFGAAPSQFTPVATFVNTPGKFSTTRTNIALPNGTIDNQAGPVWLRIVALAPSVGGNGYRETFGIDNFGLSWAAGAACTPVALTAQPGAVASYLHNDPSFTVTAVGTEPLRYVWVKNGATLLSDDGHFRGTGTPTLSITNVQLADQGTYSCIVSNVCDGTVYSQTSAGAELAVNIPPAVSIGYLRTLVDPNSFTPTNVSLLYQATGRITTATNIAASDVASYYLQDETGGINLYAPYDASFRPNLGDEVTVVGHLYFEQGNLELLTDQKDTTQSTTIWSNNITHYPVAKVVPWDNLDRAGSDANLNYNFLGSVVMLSPVYFGTNAGALTWGTNNFSCVVTNAHGKSARLFLPTTQVNDLTNRTLPAFAYAVQGPLVATPSGYEVILTRWVDLLSTPLTLAATPSGQGCTLRWTAVPLTYSYTVLGADNAAGPYSVLATGLKFADTHGSYTDSGAGGGYRFYRVSSP